MDKTIMQKMKNIRLILLDMDGVIADFHSHAIEVGNRSGQHRFALDHIKGGDCLAKLYGYIAQDDYFEYLVRQSKSFWFDIPAYDWIDELIRYVRYLGRTKICTTPQCSPESWGDKIRWLKVHGWPWYDVIMTIDKSDLAKPDVLLIDDNQSNVDRFRKSGGHAVLVPSKWNTSDLSLEMVVTTINKYIHENL